MSTIDITGTGMEQIGREVLLILATHLNDELAVVEAAWAERDAALEAAIPHGTPPITLERFEALNMHLGHIPSLIEAPVHQYPNLAVLVDTSGTANADAQLDHAWARVDNLAVEMMVKAGPYDRDDTSGIGEDVCNRRVQRTIEAAVRVLAAHRTLDGLVQEIPEMVRVAISDVFVKYDEDDRGPKFFWQGARLDYSIPTIQQAY